MSDRGIRASVVWLAIAGVVLGCVRAPVARSVLTSGVRSSVAEARVRVAFHADLSAADDGSTTPEAPTATLDLTFRDDGRFEYRLVVEHAALASASLALVDREDGGARIVIATDLAIQGAYVQVRGTGVLSDQRTAAASLLERLRMPRRFQARLSTSHGAQVLLGEVR